MMSATTKCLPQLKYPLTTKLLAIFGHLASKLNDRLCNLGSAIIAYRDLSVGVAALAGSIVAGSALYSATVKLVPFFRALWGGFQSLVHYSIPTVGAIGIYCTPIGNKWIWSCFLPFGTPQVISIFKTAQLFLQEGAMAFCIPRSIPNGKYKPTCADKCQGKLKEKTSIIYDTFEDDKISQKKELTVLQCKVCGSISVWQRFSTSEFVAYDYNGDLLPYLYNQIYNLADTTIDSVVMEDARKDMKRRCTKCQNDSLHTVTAKWCIEDKYFLYTRRTYLIFVTCNNCKASFLIKQCSFKGTSWKEIWSYLFKSVY